MVFSDLLALLTAVGAGSALTALVNGMVGWLSGRAGREKEHNQDLVAQRDRAWQLVEQERKRADAAEAEAQHANSTKRQALELASAHRSQLLLNNIEAEKEWPKNLY